MSDIDSSIEPIEDLVAELKKPANRAVGKSKRDVRSEQNRRRHAARELAVQSLYEVDIAGHSADEVLARTRATQATPEDTFEYLSTISRGIRLNQDEIDGYITDAAPAFPLPQLAPIDRSVLRVAIFELLHQPSVPAKVAINEAIDLAKRYGGDNSGRFVNGVLGTVFQKIESERAASSES